jgi:hypothetical protein
MASINQKIKDIIKAPSIRLVSVALAISMLVSYIFEDKLLSIKLIILTFVAINLIAYVIGIYLKESNYLNALIIGTASYFGYIFILAFLKLIERPPILEEQIKAALIFGAITVATYWLIDIFVEG